MLLLSNANDHLNSLIPVGVIASSSIRIASHKILLGRISVSYEISCIFWFWLSLKQCWLGLHHYKLNSVRLGFSKELKRIRHPALTKVQFRIWKSSSRMTGFWSNIMKTGPAPLSCSILVFPMLVHSKIWKPGHISKRNSENTSILIFSKVQSMWSRFCYKHHSKWHGMWNVCSGYCILSDPSKI